MAARKSDGVVSSEPGRKKQLTSPNGTDPAGIYSGMNKRSALSDGDWLTDEQHEEINRTSRRSE